MVISENVLLEDRRSHPRQGLKNHIRTTLRVLLWNTDTSILKVMLAIASAIWSFGLFSNPHIFTEFKSFELMRSMASPYAWATIYGAHAMLLIWRLFDPVARLAWAQVINAIGIGLWWTVTISLYLSIRQFSPALGLDIATCLTTFWIFIRTGIGHEKVTL